MGPDDALELMNQLLLNSFLIAAPVLIVCLAVGLLVSVLQVATQLQEMTLSYVPKLLAAALVLVALGPWMIHRMTLFATTVIGTISGLG